MVHNVIKKLIVFAITAAMLISMVPAVFAADVSDFTDFPTWWSAEAVEAAIDNGLLQGRTPTTLVPKGNLTRAEMATIINRAFGAVIEADISKFTDVPSDAWYYSEIKKAVNMQTFIGDTGNTMRPEASITREEVFAVIARALVLESDDYSVLSEFHDADMVSDWAKPYASILVAKDYVNGNDLSYLCPKDNITREEFAQIMHNIIKTYFTTAGDFLYTGPDSTLIRTTGVTLRNMTIEGDLILGDGVGFGKVNLINVTIKGRLLCRGGEDAVKLTNTTVGEIVVIKDVNGIVNFHNYRSEKPFVGIREITPATFLKDSGVVSGGGSSSGKPSSTKKYTVEFFNGIDDSESLGDISVTSGSRLTDAKINSFISGIDKKREGYKDGNYTHMIYPEAWYKDENGEWKIFDSTVEVESDIDVHFSFKNIAASVKVNLGGIESPLVTVSAPYESTTRFNDTVKDAMTLGRNQFVAAFNKKDVYAEYIEKLSEDYDFLIDADGNIKYIYLEPLIVEIIGFDEVKKEIRQYITEGITGKKIDDATRLETAEDISDFQFDAVVEIIENLGIEAGSVEDKISAVRAGGASSTKAYASEVWTAVENQQAYKDFVAPFGNKDAKVAVTPESRGYLMAVASAVDSYTYEILADRIHARFGELTQLLGDEEAEKFLRKAQDRYIDGAEKVWNDLETSATAEYDTFLTFMVNPVEHLMKPVYKDSYTKKLDSAKTNYYYDSNADFKDLIDGQATDEFIADMFVYDAAKDDDVYTGYALYGKTNGESGFMHYYDYILDTIILSDKAMLWYKDNLDSDELESVQTAIYAGKADSLNAFSEMIDNYEADGTLPFGLDIDELKSIAALADIISIVEPKAQDIIADYKASSNYGTDWTASKVEKGIKYAKEGVEILLGLDDPTFTADSFMENDEFWNDKGFAGYEYPAADDEAFGTVTIIAVEKDSDGNYIGFRNYLN